MKDLILLRADYTHLLRRSIVGYLGVERRQFRYLDEITEALFLYDAVRHGELKIRRLLGKDGRPCAKTADVLPFKFSGTEVLEEQIQFRERVADGRPLQEGRAQILARAFLYGADGKEHVEGFTAAFRIAESRHTVVPGVEHQVLELVALIDKDVVDAHFGKIHHVILPAVDVALYFLQLCHEVVLAFLQSLEHRIGYVLALTSEHFKVFLHRVELSLQDTLLHFQRLGVSCRTGRAT